METNRERQVKAYEALTRARKLARELDRELSAARGAFDGMEGEKMWLGQFWSGVLWMLLTAVREVGVRVHRTRKETWGIRW